MMPDIRLQALLFAITFGFVLILAGSPYMRVRPNLANRLVADKQVHSADIHVKTVDGVVTLTGTTSSQADIDRAVQDANSVKGVKSVVNKLEIKS